MGIHPDEIHLWFLFGDELLEADHKALCIALLSRCERIQMDQLLFARNKQQFLLARILVRSVLSLYFPQIRPEGWEFSRTPDGRPYIATPLAISVDFNISHTNGLVVLGISQDRKIGVDAEYVDDKRNLVSNAHSYLSDKELGNLEMLLSGQKTRYAYQLWTLKEAFLKAYGTEYSISPKTLNFDLSGKTELS